MRSVSVCIATILLLGSIARGQTTRPVSEPWVNVVDQFAQALTKNDPNALVPILSDDVCVQGLDAKPTDALRLLSRTHGTMLIASQAYVHAPPRLATDIAEAFSQTSVSDDLKRYMTPSTGTQMTRANTAAAKWLTESLNAKPGDLVGIAVFWRSVANAARQAEGARPEIIFVFTKGTITGSTARIDLIAFGSPQQHISLSAN